MKRILLTLMFLITSIGTFANGFIEDGISYRIMSENEVAVTGGIEYKGKVVIPSSPNTNKYRYRVTRIDDYAFQNCTGLTSVIIPESVTSIGLCAFSGCSSLTSVIIPESVKIIGRRAFEGCSSITSPLYTKHIFVYLPKGFKGNYTIPEGVTDITDDAFIDSDITSLFVPNSVKNIDNHAFNAYHLTSVSIGDGVTCIGPYFCQGNSILTSISIGNGLTSIGKEAFRGCSSLTSVSIGNSLGVIDEYAFSNCPSLTSIVLPNSLCSIGSTSFQESKSIKSVTISCKDESDFCNYIQRTDIPTIFYQKFLNAERSISIGGEIVRSITIPNSVTNIGIRAFCNCSGLTSVTIPNSVTSIGGAAFNGCSGLTSVTIPNSVTSIGGGTFCDCSGLTSVIIPNSVTSIGYEAFRGCSGLTSMIIPNSVTSIGIYAFLGCSGLTSVTIPNSVTSIGINAFMGCSGLTSVTIPNSVTSIGDGTFFNCSGLTSVTIPNSVTSIGDDAFRGCSGLTSVTIPNSVTSIGGTAFYGCSGLTSVTIPNSVTSIGINAFGGCNNVKQLIYAKGCVSALRTFLTSITSLSIPNSVSSIENYAFYGSTSLKSITIPSSVSSVGNYAFGGCYMQTNRFINNSSLDYNPNWGLTLCDIEQNDGLLIKDNVAVMCRKWATSVTIPNSVTSIGIAAFEDCSNLLSVTIPNSITSIEGRAFSHCSGLTSVSIPNSVTCIGSFAFNGCSSLTSVTIPNSVTSIGGTAFSGCSGLTSMIIPNSVSSIGRAAFSDCSALTSVTIPNSITTINDRTFSNCTALSSVIIPNSVTDIKEYAFNGCSSLSFVSIGNSIKKIDYALFYDCSRLLTVIINATTPPDFARPYVSSKNAILYVPDESLAKYQESIIGRGEYFSQILPLSEIEQNNELVAGTYFIKNASATGKDAYLEAGLDWGTHAMLGHGIDIDVVSLEDGKYMLDTHIQNSNGLHVLGSNSYMDSNSTLYITRAQDNLFTISTEDGLLLSADGAFVSFEADGKNSLWQFVTPKERLTELNSATNDNPQDATWLIKDPDFSIWDTRISYWNEIDAPSQGGRKTNMNSQKWGADTQTFTVQQTLTLPNGWYKLSAQGFYRYNNTEDNTNDIAISTHADGTEIINSYLFAGDVQVPLPSIADDEASMVLSELPMQQKAAGDAFDKGLYSTSLYVEVKNGQLPIGVKKIAHPGCDWTVFDNFELTYYGTSMPDLPEDINKDGKIDALDVKLLVKKITDCKLLGSKDPDYNPDYDFNKDGKIDVKDVTFLINKLVKK